MGTADDQPEQAGAAATSGPAPGPHGEAPRPGLVRVVRTLERVEAARWDALDHDGSPFLEHGFLRALERSRSIGPGTGWDPHYVLVEADLSERAGDDGPGAHDRAPRPLLGAIACFVKHHSYGEYIFDFGWARAAQRGGVRYYPKLVVAAPVTPASGPRLLLAPGLAPAQREAVVTALIHAARGLADEHDCSSIHWLFHREHETETLRAQGFAPRASFQYHWRNRGWRDFDDFLQALTSRKRKQLRKERARARAAVDEIEWVAGDQLQPDDLAAIDRFYRNTTDEHGGQDYLRPGFFEALRTLLPHRVQWVRARRGGKTIAGALYLETDRALFGRYWGADVPVEFLHFELAYYCGIERCIARGLPLFEAGAQGEHKLLRGFAPSATHSAHWIRHAGLRGAVDRFLAEEHASIEQYLRELATLQPYRAGSDDDDARGDG
jgi:predicted N-acyltransferase